MTMTTKELLLQHYSRLTAQLQSVEVPELGPEVRIYFRPVESLKEMETTLKLVVEGDRTAVIADKFVRRALNADGTRMFPNKAERIEVLRHMDGNLVARIVQRIEAYDADAAHAEAAGKP